ncbi:MAG: aminotransferase class I/II-fold pyridoxal phosphate-dependent enzyme [Candidatus Marinimicrobia bacterium]|nr:aminotransferase class I/II-fold pyridoxal phosphate-dependent enzyme [Candidatus Neomarinimicrobiota bacterium]MCF7830117.1 aminotransferase class I/II-fold pyridoxal phosphate-dependent enzyme [Candidatus Neomarinimicrobiota bacterium]MCF7882486.1 aminotransferase class I/II-fold pyridoxal phosphate-dependent enzyme [Candidatus Neomarinimicrobiota bacterium]
MDIFEKCWEFTDAKTAREEGWYPYFIPITENKDGQAIVDGVERIMIGSNNYLGLTYHPKVLAAAKEATDKYGSGCTGSRFLNGTLDMHEELETKLAEFMHCEAALVYSTGYQTNLGVISTLVGKDDYVIMDKLNHASIVDGGLLSFGETVRYRHNDMEDLERVLSKIDEDAGKLIVVDGVFSMEGDIAPLPDILEIANEYGARLMVDDAHSIGVLGDHGRGTAEHWGVEEEVDLIMGTFSKSFACVGGFIAGKKDVVDFLQHKSRSLIFSASMTPSSVATVIAALEVIQEEPERREHLWEITRYMQEGYTKLGFDIGKSATPVIPVIIGDNMKTFGFWKALYQDGVYSNPVVSPAVPEKSSRLRTSYMATHSKEQMDKVLAKFEEHGKQFGII